MLAAHDWSWILAALFAIALVIQERRSRTRFHQTAKDHRVAIDAATSTISKLQATIEAKDETLKVTTTNSRRTMREDR